MTTLHVSDTPLGHAPLLATEAARAMARALAPGGSDAGLRSLVFAYTRALRDDGVPPEQALVRVKRLITTALPCGSRGTSGVLRVDAIGNSVASWFVAAYYRAD